MSRAQNASSFRETEDRERMDIDDSETRTGRGAWRQCFRVPARGICATIEPNTQRVLTAVPDAAF